MEINGEQALTTYEIKNLNYLDKVLINLGLGDKAESQKEYETGKMFIRYSQDLIVSMKDFEQISTLGEF